MMKNKLKRKSRDQRFDMLIELAREAEAQGLSPDEAFWIYGPDVRDLMRLSVQIREISAIFAEAGLSVDDVRRSIESMKSDIWRA